MAKTLFFIDDDQDFIYVVERTCRKIDGVAGVYTAANGKDALEKIESWIQGETVLPDLMFVDINMPYLDGFEFLAEFKALREKLEILTQIMPIVMLTSSLHEADKEKALNTGIVDDFVIKSSDASGMEQTIRKFVG